MKIPFHFSSLGRMKSKLSAVPVPKSSFVFVACGFVILFITTYYHYPESRIIYHEEDQEIPNFSSLLQVKEKWIVITSISHPTEQIKRLIHEFGNEWNLLVVADMKTPKNWSHPGAIFLDVEAQNKLGYEVLKHLPWNAYTRKMVGYLFAIEHGAKVIYDTDDDNCPDNFGEFEKGLMLNLEPHDVYGLVVDNGSSSSSVLYNPYTHFTGQDESNSIWPRGYPLDLIGEERNNSFTACKIRRRPAIQQGLVNGDPDVDAIYRLTKKKVYVPLNITFDPVAPPIHYSTGVLSPFNSQNTIFHYEAFWALMLPISVTFRVTDIWRGYWAQPLLWIIQEHLGFFTAHTTQIRNAHNYLKDFAEETQFYDQAGKFAKFLTQWKCEKEGADEFKECLLQLTEDMANSNFWGMADVALAKAWVQDLKTVGYKMPLKKSSREVKSSSLCSPVTNRTMTRAVFNAKQPLKDVGKSRLRELCPSASSKVPHPIGGRSYFPKTLLIITFNFPHFDFIWLLELIYRPHYPNILYCADATNTTFQDLNVVNNATGGAEKISFVHANLFNGYFAYECALRAIEMNYGVDDYIVLSDDIMFRFWETMGRDDPMEVWTSTFGSFAHTCLTIGPPEKSNPNWNWWNSTYGFEPTRRILESIYSKAGDTGNINSNSTNVNTIFPTFVKNRALTGFNGSTLYYSSGDFFHFSKPQNEIFHEIGWIMRENELFLELALPILLHGLSSQGVRNLPGIALWGEGRNDPFSHFPNYSNRTVFHPIKLGKTLNNTKVWGDYCQNYVTELLNYS